MDNNMIFVTGYAKLPQGITAQELYSVIAVGLVIDRESGMILNADCTLATDLAKNFVKRILVGTSINDIELLEYRFKTLYFGSARKSIISGLKTCHEKFKQITENGVDSVDEEK